MGGFPKYCVWVDSQNIAYGWIPKTLRMGGFPKHCVWGDSQNIAYGGSPQTDFTQVSSAKNRLSHDYTLLKGVTETVRETFDMSRPIWIELHRRNVHKNYSVAIRVVVDRDSSVGIATGYGLDGPGIECR
jgi:hypothetical protein